MDSKFTGAFAIYLEPWHADIFEFLDLRKNHGKVNTLEYYRRHFWVEILETDYQLGFTFWHLITATEL